MALRLWVLVLSGATVWYVPVSILSHHSVARWVTNYDDDIKKYLKLPVYEVDLLWKPTGTLVAICYKGYFTVVVMCSYVDPSCKLASLSPSHWFIFPPPSPPSLCE